MESKVFSITKTNGNVKMQIGNDVFGLDDSERHRLTMLFTNIKNTRVCFPAGIEGTCILYENGIIAANINASKLHITGTKYLLMVYSLTPNSTKYDVNNFVVSGEMVDEFLAALAD